MEGSMEGFLVADFPDYAQLANIQLIEELYSKYSADPTSVDSSWRAFFEGIDFAGLLHRRPDGKADMGASVKAYRILSLIQAFRRFGHLRVKINPIDPNPAEAPELSLHALGFSESELNESFPTQGFGPGKEAPLSEIIANLSAIYCSRIGFEFSHLNNFEMERWIQERIEPKLPIAFSSDEKKSIFELLHKAELFEVFMHTKYVGQTRFSLEGSETLIPLVAELIERGAQLGCTDYHIGMAHRGRLNVLTHILNKPYSMVFQEFEDVIAPYTTEGTSEVKYHRGFVAKALSRTKIPLTLHLAANSSALESVNAIVLGSARAAQVLAKDESRKKTAAILIHGDASVAGQGVIYEAMQFMRLPGYSTGGTLHIVVNNQIGFTTLPEEGRSTRYATDIAKAFECPIFHVNAEDPESCLFAARLAMEFRLAFQRDVFIDLNCYRKYGHNEGDEPSYTQPTQYQIIRAKQPIRELYRQQLMSEGLTPTEAQGDEAFKAMLNAAQARGKQQEPHKPEERFGSSWKEFTQPNAEMLFEPFDTSVKEEVLHKVAECISTIPTSFHLHPKLTKWLQARANLATPIEWAMAETLAFGTLLLQQIPIRLAGQDCRRGTFSQRHAVLVDAENGSLYFPLEHLDPAQARCVVYNSPLSEYACLAFEYGYTWVHPTALVLWEAQYGDFNNGAQIIIDQYIVAAEQKGARYSSLVLLLPHAFEGQGPEHSSGRIERFLQLAAANNSQIVNATTPAQYFHLLRRQALRKIKKPLIVFTPKSLLRQPTCTSLLKEFTSGQFEEFIDDPKSQNPKRVLFCSGKVYYDLLSEREKRQKNEIAIVRIEQLYPIHQKKLDAILSKYAHCLDLRWVQEEPENMGAWEFIRDYLPKATYVGRDRSPVVATGSYRQHKQELEQFMNKAFE